MSRAKKQDSIFGGNLSKVVELLLSAIAILSVVYNIFSWISEKNISLSFWEFLAPIFAGVLLFNLFATKHLIHQSDPIIKQQLSFEDNNYPLSKPKRDGFLIFDCPELMAVDKEEIVTAEVFIKKELYNQSTDKSQIEQIEVTNEMSARLFGRDFEITAYNNELQAILPHKKTRWQWEVKPTKHGDKQIRLVISAKIKNEPSGFQQYDFAPIMKVVLVKVKRVYLIKKFFKANWQWLVNLVAGTGLTFSLLKAFGVIQ